MRTPAKVIKGAFSELTINSGPLFESVQNQIRASVTAAAKVAAAVMRSEISWSGPSAPGQPPAKATGRLRRGVGHWLNKDTLTAAVGSSDQKTHLLEFGHGAGKEKNARPFVFRSLRKAEPEIVRILSEPLNV